MPQILVILRQSLAFTLQPGLRHLEGGQVQHQEVQHPGMSNITGLLNNIFWMKLLTDRLSQHFPSATHTILGYIL